MESEWNLSDKAVLTLGFNKENSFTFEEKDVREFIKKLKDMFCNCYECTGYLAQINKLAGDKLV